MSQRLEKVQHLAQEVLGETIQGLKDPRIGFTTVTHVRISPDLRHARVLVSVLGNEEEQEATMAGLRSAAPFVRAQLGREVRLKYVPELVFELDRGAETAERLEELFHRIHGELEQGGRAEEGS